MLYTTVSLSLFPLKTLIQKRKYVNNKDGYSKSSSVLIFLKTNEKIAKWAKNFIESPRFLFLTIRFKWETFWEQKRTIK